MITNTELAIRIFFATLFGIAVGYERTNRNKEAGIRTHAIVALASALVMIISKYAFKDVGRYDASRVASQIISGIGFLGAGLIFVKNNSVISGLTTAAGVWATAGVGMAVGAGEYFLGFFSTILMVSIQIIFHQNNFFTKGEGHRQKLYIKLNNMETYIKIKPLITEKMTIEALSINKSKNEVHIELELLMKETYQRFILLEHIIEYEGVIGAYWE